MVTNYLNKLQKSGKNEWEILRRRSHSSYDYFALTRMMKMNIIRKPTLIKVVLVILCVAFLVGVPYAVGTTVKVGDTIMYPFGVAGRLNYNNKKYHMVMEHDIMAILED